ncbi:hypothetical protein pdam_00022643 [Pocillopora damicornis]|uniref:HAT C-terminal dimerisation domain-containing protein n=1 Tax=Pocillopora damicornis TaxID=46731 RepID=A0A3M6U9F9_POCDA|nr:hypothetical protein pdam_00022643 [Pocillopora damicornis]
MLQAKKKSIVESQIVESFSKINKDMQSQRWKEMEAKINTTYFIAKEELPFSKFEGLLMSQSKNGVILNNIYAKKKSCAELVSFLSEGFRDDPIHVLKWKNYFSLMADRTADFGGTENETVVWRFVRDGVPVICIWGHKAVTHAHAEAIVSPSDDITEWDRRVVAFRADEASVNLGKKGGVAVLMRKDIPDHVVFHCLPHRLELALLEMQKSCKSVKEVCDVLNLVWKTHHYSVKSSRDLKALASELNKEELNTNSSTWDTMVARRQARLKETVTSMSCLKSPHAPNCYLETFLKVPNNLVVLYEDQFCNKDYSSLWKMFLVKDPYKSDLKDILQLVEILLLLPISAARCERMISFQNRINSSLRAALKKSSLEGLIRISAENWSLEEFDTLLSVDR